MRRELFVSLVAAAFMLCSCTSELTPNDPVGSEPAKAMAVAVYQGHDLFCIEQKIGHGSVTYTCDFAAFYNQPATTGSRLPTAKVAPTTMPYRGKTLHCFKFNTAHVFEAYTCDFERFYRENKAADLLPN